MDLAFPPSHPEVGDGDFGVLVVELLLPHLLLVLVFLLKTNKRRNVVTKRAFVENKTKTQREQ